MKLAAASFMTRRRPAAFSTGPPSAPEAEAASTSAAVVAAPSAAGSCRALSHASRDTSTQAGTKANDHGRTTSARLARRSSCVERRRTYDTRMATSAPLTVRSEHLAFEGRVGFYE